MRKLIILGSSRSNGETAKIAHQLKLDTNWDMIDLNSYNISYYDYAHNNKDDDFLPLIKQIITNYDVLIFATPVYWYSMSGIMKVFFDRLTDLLDIEKDWGRKLRGKKMAALSCSAGNHLEEYFWLPFSESANYLGMTFIAGLHTQLYEDEIPAIDLANMRDFVAKIQQETN